MFDRNKILGLVMVAALAACDDGMSPNEHGTASVQGSVESTREPAPEREPAPSGEAAPPSPAPGPTPETVSVVQLRGNGTFAELATASVAFDGSFDVEGVPAGRSDLAVLAYAGGEVVGGVLIHETSRAGAVIVAAPINYETTVEAEAYARVRADGDDGSASELSLLVHMQGSAAQRVATSAAEIEAVAAGYVAASTAMTRAYAASGASLDASARAEALSDAAVQFAAERHAGVSASAAHEAFTDAALDAYVAAGAGLQQSLVASAAAATMFDATLYGESSARADVVAQAVRMNLRARERLAAELSTAAEASLGHAIRLVLGEARVTLALGAVLDLRGFVETTADAAVEVAADAAVQVVAGGATAEVRAEVRARAIAALEAARLDARLEGATTAAAAASVVAGYRASVRAAVDAMIAAAGSTSARADVVTDLFIAACGNAYIR
jgi:hypothetical protein